MYVLIRCDWRIGTVQIRNWKPVSCDVITDNPSATIDDVLGAQLASLTTLRIRLRRCVIIIIVITTISVFSLFAEWPAYRST